MTVDPDECCSCDKKEGLKQCHGCDRYFCEDDFNKFMGDGFGSCCCESCMDSADS